MKRFALIGAAGYVAPRHMKAIRETGNTLLAAYDPNDSVGVLDSWFPKAHFFTELERFDRFLEKQKHQQTPCEYLTVCSPNYLHDAHIRFGLRHGMNVICEKPLVLSPWNAASLLQTEQETGKKVNTILQLRHHPVIQALKQEADRSDQVAEVELTYITPRGPWYYTSWKGDIHKSGGIATNIGVHFFDMLLWVFGDVQQNIVHLHTHDRAAGFLHLKKAQVRWFLSINSETLPASATPNSAYRAIKINGQTLEFSEGFADLHTLSYKAVLDNQGFGISEVLPAIQLTHQIREATPQGPDELAHQSAFLPTGKHPFE